MKAILIILALAMSGCERINTVDAEEELILESVETPSMPEASPEPEESTGPEIEPSPEPEEGAGESGEEVSDEENGA